MTGARVSTPYARNPNPYVIMSLPQTFELLKIMAHLRDRDGGCPWDIEQTFETIAPHTIEEAYEVVEAIASGDRESLKDELGDLLLQVVFHSQMAAEEGSFTFEDVAAAINEKLIRRHPHLFGEATVETAEDQVKAWEALKAEERRIKAKKLGKDIIPSALDGVPVGLPALTRAEKLTKRAARVGFDWPDIEPVFAKLQEEIDELKAALQTKADKGKMADELGDILFVCANLARHLKVEPEDALRGTNRKFERRFQFIEQELAKQGRKLEDVTLKEMDALWDKAKHLEDIR